MCGNNAGIKRKTLLSDMSAVSEVVGTILLLALVVSGTSIFLLAGNHIISGAKSSAEINGAEQAFTMADSRLSKARFSTSIFQEAAFELGSGTVIVDGSWDNSHIIVYDINNSREIFNKSLGTIRYIARGGEVAYQDGGVWRSDGRGGSVMLSPPDFDYNGVTLTLPVMRIDGSGSMGASGNTKVLLCVNSTDPEIVYPLEGLGGNPVPQGHAINITIKSDYYQAWADYINERTRATAEVDPVKKIVNISLRTGTPMQSGLASMGFTTKSMDVSSDAPISTFKLNLVLRNTGNDHTITYGVKSPDGNTPDPDLRLTVSRTKGSGNKEFAYVEWKYKNGSLEEIFSTTIPFERKSDETMDLDLMDPNLHLEYNGPSASTVTWGDLKDDPDSSAMKVEYNDPSYSDVTIGQTKTMHDLSQHYMRLMAEYDQENGNMYNGPIYEVIGKSKYDGAHSTFRLSYESSQDIKYLYITEGILKTSLAARS